MIFTLVKNSIVWNFDLIDYDIKWKFYSGYMHEIKITYILEAYKASSS